MPYSISLVEKIDKVEPELKGVLWAMLSEIEQHREASVTKTEFKELRDIVKEIVEVQKATDVTMKEIAGVQKATDITMKEIVEVQKTTDVTMKEIVEVQKTTDVTMKELAEAQKRTEVKVGELTDAQKRTEVKFGELTDAQKRTEVKFGELTDAQKRTEVKVEELTDAQKRTEVRMEELTVAQKEMTEAQKQTDTALKELAEAQKRTEVKMEELAEAQKQTEIVVVSMSNKLNNVADQTGGLTKSSSYSLENEGYRKLPAYLKTHYQIEVKEKFVRKTIGGKEVNVFAHALHNGQEVLIVGEAVLRLKDNNQMSDFEKTLNAVKTEYTEPMIPLVITHFAQSDMLQKTEQRGVIVVQSFQWD